MTEKYISIQKLNGGFIIEYNDDKNDQRKIVRKLSEVVALVKEQLVVRTRNCNSLRINCST